jgi:hypothetical protein
MTFVIARQSNKWTAGKLSLVMGQEAGQARLISL